MRVFLCAALGAITLGSSGLATGQNLPRDVPVHIPCFERADDITTLQEEHRETLCRGASSAAPVGCFVQAKDRTILGDQEALRLCRCADGPAPVDCFIRGEESSPSLEDDQLVNSCRSAVRDRLNPVTCKPLPR